MPRAGLAPAFPQRQACLSHAVVPGDCRAGAGILAAGLLAELPLAGGGLVHVTCSGRGLSLASPGGRGTAVGRSQGPRAGQRGRPRERGHPGSCVLCSVPTAFLSPSHSQPYRRVQQPPLQPRGRHPGPFLGVGLVPMHPLIARPHCPGRRGAVPREGLAAAAGLGVVSGRGDRSPGGPRTSLFFSSCGRSQVRSSAALPAAPCVLPRSGPPPALLSFVLSCFWNLT